MRQSFTTRQSLAAILANAVIAGCLFVGAGCSSQAKSARHLARAGQYFQAGKYREAAIEYMNVLKVEPTNRVAVRGMGLTLYEMGDVRAAVPCLLKAEDLDPGDADVRLKLGTLYLVMGDSSKARERAEAVLKRTPDNLDALVLWGAGVSASNEVASAIDRLTARAAQFNDQPKYYTTLATLHARKGDFAAAEQVCREALEKIPKSWEIHLALGDLHVRMRDLPRAGEEYQTAADLAPVKSMARVKLARFLWIGGRDAEAKKILDDLLKQVPRFYAASLCRAEIAVGEHDYDVAMKILGGVLKTEPSNLEAFLLIQRVKMAQGKDEEAIAAYEKLAAAFPKSAQGRHLLGLARLHKGAVQKAIGEFERAVALDADHLESVRLLAELYIRTRQPDLALALLKPVATRHPGEAFAYVLTGEAYGQKKDFAQAAETYRNFINALPANPQGPYLLGQALRRLGRDPEAAAMFEEALKIEPGFAEALEQLTGIMFARRKNWDEAVGRIERQIEKVPDAAGLHYLLGNVLLQKRDWDNAEKAFQKAIQIKHEITAAYVGLSQVYMATHKEDQALGKLDSALGVNSNDVAALMMKGTLLMNRNDPINAAAQYRRILAVSPAFVPALNNLACLYQDERDTKDKAYEFAKRARDLAPRDPHVADTLGWILFRRGESKWALALLEESAGQLAGQPEALYHLGMCQAALGDDEKARASLIHAVELAKTFPGSVEAEEMLAALTAGEDLRELAAAGQVEAFLAKHPDNPIAQTKAGAYYERVGDYDRARTLYEKAIAMNGHFVPALVRLAELCSVHLDQMDRAVALARQAREEAPRDSRVADELAALAFRKGDYKWAQSLLTEIAGQAGATPERQYLLGMTHYALGRTEAATNLIGQALSAGPAFASAEAARRFMDRVKNPALAMGKIKESELTTPLTVENLPLLMYVAGTYEQKGEKDKARSLYEQAVARYPDFGPAFRRLALSFTGQTAISDQEFKVLGKARELLPDDPSVGGALGEAAFLKGQYEWAARLLQESAAGLPSRADVQYYLGMSYDRLKNKGAARKALSRGLELDPRSDLAPGAREILDRMQ